MGRTTPKIAPSPWDLDTHLIQRYFGPPESAPNGISIGLADFARFSKKTGPDKNRPRYSDCSNSPHLMQCMRCDLIRIKQGVALTGRNRTGPPCSVGHPTAHAPGSRPARLPAGSVTDDDIRRRQTTTTDDRRQRNNTGPLGGPVIRIRK